MKYGSRLVEEAVEQFASLPGIGRKTALRLALHMLQRDGAYTERFTSALLKLRADIKRCTNCCNISDTEICGICQNPVRDPSIICVVESIRDVMAIEDTGQFKGLYHVLGGIISPIEGITPEDLFIKELEDRIEKGDVKELILAISPTIDGETTNFYLYKLFTKFDIQLSQLSRGISFGGELEYADELTLGRSLQSRMPYQDGMK